MAGTGMAMKSPKCLAIKAVIESEAGVRTAKEASAKGKPAVCELDKLLRETIVNYTDDDQSIKTAGSLIANVLVAAGYTKGPQRSCGPGCHAKGGALWFPPAPSSI